MNIVGFRRSKARAAANQDTEVAEDYVRNDASVCSTARSLRSADGASKYELGAAADMSVPGAAGASGVAPRLASRKLKNRDVRCIFERRVEEMGDVLCDFTVKQWPGKRRQPLRRQFALQAEKECAWRWYCCAELLDAEVCEVFANACGACWLRSRACIPCAGWSW